MLKFSLSNNNKIKKAQQLSQFSRQPRKGLSKIQRRKKSISHLYSSHILSSILLLYSLDNKYTFLNTGFLVSIKII